MKKFSAATALAIACVAALSLLWEGRVCAGANCKAEYYPTAPDTDRSGNCDQMTCTYLYTKHWGVYFMDGHGRNIDPFAYGVEAATPSGRLNCAPSFEPPTFVDDGLGSARWKQLSHDGLRTFAEGKQTCSNRLDAEKWTVSYTCRRAGVGNCTTPSFDGSCPYPTMPDGFGNCCTTDSAGSCEALGYFWDEASQVCRDLLGGFGDCLGGDGFACDLQFVGDCLNPFYGDPAYCGPSPVVVDVAGDGFRLTGADGGVSFDLDNDGAGERVSWTAAGSDDAWLAFDRDRNGFIDSGRELFGNYTPQPLAAPPNGFQALAAFDEPARGGNADGLVDGRDAVFAYLRLWRDANHDGVSQPSELHTLPESDVVRIHLDYKESKRTDEYGNAFRYRAKVDDARGAKVGRWAWDAFLVGAP